MKTKYSSLFFAILTICALLSACGASPSSSASISAAPAAGSGSISNNANTISLSGSAVAGGGIADLLIMKDNTSLTNAPGAILFSTPSGMDEVIAFYTDVLKGLGAEGSEERNSSPALDTWAWIGTYSSGNGEGTIDILVVRNENGAGVSISYT